MPDRGDEADRKRPERTGLMATAAAHAARALEAESDR